MYVGNVAMLECWNLVLETWVLVCIVLSNFGRWSWSWKLYTCTCISGFKWIKYSKSACVCGGTAVREAVPQGNMVARACQQARASRAISLQGLWVRPLPGPVQDWSGAGFHRSGPVQDRSQTGPVLGPDLDPYSVLGPDRSGPGPNYSPMQYHVNYLVFPQPPTAVCR